TATTYRLDNAKNSTLADDVCCSGELVFVCAASATTGDTLAAVRAPTTVLNMRPPCVRPVRCDDRCNDDATARRSDRRPLDVVAKSLREEFFWRAAGRPGRAPADRRRSGESRARRDFHGRDPGGSL